MLAGLASPSHLILVLVLVLLLFGAKRIPQLGKGLGAGLKELRDGISSSGDARAESSDGESIRGEAPAGSGGETSRTHSGQRGR